MLQTGIVGEHEVIGTVNLRPQDLFKNPKAYRLHPDHDVEYCAFKVDAPKRPGIYRIFVSGDLVYIGRAANLHNRLSVQYGTVSPRHPYAGGQLQKCRTNSKINTALCQGLPVVVRWEVCEDFVAREKELLSDPLMRPPWNRRA